MMMVGWEGDRKIVAVRCLVSDAAMSEREEGSNQNYFNHWINNENRSRKEIEQDWAIEQSVLKFHNEGNAKIK